MKEYQVGLTAPPFHPNCRGTTCPYFDDDFGTRVGRDAEGNTVELPADTTYEEWKKKFVDISENDDTIKTDVLHSQADPMADVTGSAEVSNPDEVAAFKEELKELGVELVERENESLAYAPGLSQGKPGTVYISKGASYSAWCHEMQHVRDDYAAGWSGMRIIQNKNERFRREQRAYNIEIGLAKQIGQEDVVKLLSENLELERRKIYGLQH